MLTLNIDGNEYRFNFEHLEDIDGSRLTICIATKNGELCGRGKARVEKGNQFCRNTNRKIALTRTLQDIFGVIHRSSTDLRRRKYVWDAYFATRHGKF